MTNERTILVAAVGAMFAAEIALGDIHVTLDKLDPSDGLPMPPSNLAVVDVAVNVSADDAWTETGIYGATNNGAHLAYAYDPNGVVPTAPGVNNRFVTFFSRSRERDANARFSANGAVVLAGGLFGAGAFFEPNEINAAVYYPVYEFGRDGYVLRIALDLSAVSDPRFRLDSDNIVVSTTQLSGAVALFETFPGWFDRGLSVGSFNGGDHRSGFGIYGIPEPASGMLLIFCAGRLLRRRSA